MYLILYSGLTQNDNLMTKDELNTYKWLDAEEVRPRVPPKPRVNKRALKFQKKLEQKILDNLDML